MMKNKRIYTLKEKSKSVFWEIWTEENNVITRTLGRGKIKITTKECKDADEAEKIFNSLVNEKIKEGYYTDFVIKPFIKKGGKASKLNSDKAKAIVVTKKIRSEIYKIADKFFDLECKWRKLDEELFLDTEFYNKEYLEVYAPENEENIKEWEQLSGKSIGSIVQGIGQTGDGGQIALWPNEKDWKMWPIVYMDSEGQGPNVIAKGLGDFLFALANGFSAWSMMYAAKNGKLEKIKIHTYKPFLDFITKVTGQKPPKNNAEILSKIKEANKLTKEFLKLFK